MFDRVRRAAQQSAKTFAKSEVGRRVLASPQFQAAVMKAINTRAQVHQSVTKRVQQLAKDHKLVTKDEMAKLRRTIRELEATVDALKQEVARSKEASAEPGPQP